MSTYDGLNKFDGTTWTTYTTLNSNIPGNDIGKIGIGYDNNIWIACNGLGMSRFDGSQWITFNTGNSPIPENDIRDICVDKSGTVWIANDGLISYNGSEWNIYNTQALGLPRWVDKIAIDSSGNKWVSFLATPGIIARFDGTDWTAYTSGNSPLPHNLINDLLVDEYDYKWISTSGGGVVVIIGSGGTVDIMELKRNREGYLVYPNPARELLHLIALDNQKILDAEIINIHGQRIERIFNLSNTAQISIKHIPNGLYNLKIQAVEGTCNIKFIKL